MSYGTSRNYEGFNLQEDSTVEKVNEILIALEEELIGLRSVKDRVKEISSLLIIDKARKSMGLTCSLPSLHMSFTGGPGTGKTSVGIRMADILYTLKYVRKGHLVTVTRDDLVGQYIGHTAPKTKNVLKEAMGGILFIDEAYYLYKADNERDYGAEAIEILLQVMENQRDDLVVVFAGYNDKMEEFYKSNPGLSSRVANHINFPNYTLDELMGITKLLLDEDQYEFTGEAIDVFYHKISKMMNEPLFANGRSIKNALDQAKMHQASRIFQSNSDTITKSDLVQLTDQDVNSISLEQDYANN